MMCMDKCKITTKRKKTETVEIDVNACMGMDKMGRTKKLVLSCCG
ncbi:hypothetical protein ISN44_As05g052690 [Arabidopsis suecica]|uniref:Uncharacterized protein n=1 Tax=Arabidopsis suecica TaxID=45249 RepID=A0A8T2DSW4_ARASU|nr:hypothetical protein ISN44_As05g052690 [Arabidopsis suecica]